MKATVTEEFPREESATTEILRCRAAHAPVVETDQLAREEPLEIRVDGRSVAVTMRTPGHDKELAAGFLLSEGIIYGKDDVLDIVDSEGCETSEFRNILDVLPAPEIEVDFERLSRHVFGSSSCGVCGKASIEAIHHSFPPIAQDGPVVPMDMIVRMPDTLRDAQATFLKTGGLHASAIFDRNGRLIVLREDVGRHNALDKVIGYGLLHGLLPFDAHVLLVSGRTSFEIVQKALAARISIVCAVSAPSSLAVEFARESGQTLIGFLRAGSMNIYSHPERIEGMQAASTALHAAVAVAR